MVLVVVDELAFILWSQMLTLNTGIILAKLHHLSLVTVNSDACWHSSWTGFVWSLRARAEMPKRCRTHARPVGGGAFCHRRRGRGTRRLSEIPVEMLVRGFRLNPQIHHFCYGSSSTECSSSTPTCGPRLLTQGHLPAAVVRMTRITQQHMA